MKGNGDGVGEDGDEDEVESKNDNVDLLEGELNADVSQWFLQYLMLYHQGRARARLRSDRLRNRI